MTTEELLRNEIEALKAENARLLEFNALLQAQRKEHLDMICGPADKFAPTEEEIAEGMKSLIPFDQILAELGIKREDSRR
jgi:hypothetical protein